MSDFLSALSKVNAEHKGWSSKKEGAPPESFYLAIEEFLETACTNRPEPHFYLAIAKLVDGYIHFLLKWANGEIVLAPDLKNADEVNRFEFAAGGIASGLAELNKALSRGPLEEPVIESIKQLSKEGVEYRQIAAIWGLKAHEVERYLDGKFKLPENLVSPSVKEWRKDRQREAMAYDAAAYRWNFNRGQTIGAPGQQEPEWTPPPESVQELLVQNVPIDQIARMHNITTSEVQAVQDGMMVGVGVDESDLAALEAATAPETKKGKK